MIGYGDLKSEREKEKVEVYNDRFMIWKLSEYFFRKRRKSSLWVKVVVLVVDEFWGVKGYLSGNVRWIWILSLGEFWVEMREGYEFRSIKWFYISFKES